MLDTNYINKCIKKLKKKLKPSRLQHSFQVAGTAYALALRYGEDTDRAFLAGLLHDCAKCYPDEEQLKLCKKYGLHMTEFEESHPFLLHAKLGAFLAMKDYGVRDDKICSAILHHTTGARKMPLLDEILFVADYMEPGRNKAPNLPLIRKKAFEDLEETILLVYEGTLQYLKSSGSDIDEQSIEAFEYYQNKRSESHG